MIDKITILFCLLLFNLMSFDFTAMVSEFFLNFILPLHFPFLLFVVVCLFVCFGCFPSQVAKHIVMGHLFR